MSYNIKNIKASPIKDLTTLKCTSAFGNRTIVVKGKTYKGFHKGIDLTGGLTIVATEKGTVSNIRTTIKGYSEKYSAGNFVVVKHANKKYTMYYHLKYGSIKVKKGDKVNIGTVLGTMGSTGFSTGTHLHYGVKINGVYVNPEPYLKGTKTILPVATPVVTPTVKIVKYKVKKGDTLSKIAKKYKTTVSKLVKDNAIKDKNKIYVGQVILIK